MIAGCGRSVHVASMRLARGWTVRYGHVAILHMQVVPRAGRDQAFGRFEACSLEALLRSAFSASEAMNHGIAIHLECCLVH